MHLPAKVNSVENVAYMEIKTYSDSDEFPLVG